MRMMKLQSDLTKVKMAKTRKITKNNQSKLLLAPVAVISLPVKHISVEASATGKTQRFQHSSVLNTYFSKSVAWKLEAPWLAALTYSITASF